MRRLKLLAALPLLLTAQLAQAGYSPNGYVSNIRVQYDGVVLFDSATKVTSGCQQNSSTPRTWAFDSTNAAGQAKLALLLSAYSLHRQMYVAGTSLCSNRPTIETVDYLSMVEP